MSDPTTPPAGESGLTEEQARQYAEQLRSVPAEQIVTEMLSSLLNVAQVKLGRRDARLLIDLSGLLIEHARRYVSDELSTQVDQVLSQLRLAQVQAEGTATGPEQNDLATAPSPPDDPGAGEQPATPPPAQPPPPPAASQPPPASRLWVPGRDF